MTSPWPSRQGGRHRLTVFGKAQSTASAVFPSAFIARLETRLRRPSSRLAQSGRSKDDKERDNVLRSNMGDEQTATPTSDGPVELRPEHTLYPRRCGCGGRECCDGGPCLPPRVRQIVSSAGVGDHDAGVLDLCQDLVEFEKLVASSVERKTQELSYQLVDLLVLCGVVANGVLDHVEDFGEYEGFGTFEKHVRRSKSIAALCQKMRLVSFVRGGSWKKFSRDIAAEKESVLRFAEDRKTRFAVTDDIYKKARASALASRVKVPSTAPQVRHWFVKRDAVVDEIRLLLDVVQSGEGTADCPSAVMDHQPRVVGLAGPPGCGKSTVIAMVIAREDVRAFFHKGVVWLKVGKGAKERLPELMLRLAGMVYDLMLKSRSRTPPPRSPGVDVDREDGSNYIRRVLLGGVGDSTRGRLLVVVDDVWEVEVLEELKKAGVWVLYSTTRSAAGLMGREDGADDAAPLTLRLDELAQEEAETVLRRAAELDSNAQLPETAYELMALSGRVVSDLAFIGSWPVVHGEVDGEAWGAALDKIFYEGGGGGDGWTRRRWRTAVLRVGLAQLARAKGQNKDLYLYLAVLPKGLAFAPADAAALLHGEKCSEQDLDEVKGIVATLERWSVLSLEEGGKYRVHESHADFVRERIAEFPVTRRRALARWRKHVSTSAALFAWPLESLVQIWRTLVKLESGESADVGCPYDPVLDALERSSEDHAKCVAVFQHVARFHWLAKDFQRAHEKYARLVAICEERLGQKHLEVAEHLHNLGVCAAEVGRLEEAEKVHGRALNIREEALGADDPTVARTLHVLGVHACTAGRTADSERFLRRALSIQEKSLGANHPDTAETLHSLAGYALRVGRPEEAKQLFLRVLACWEVLDANHPKTARTLHQLGVCSYDAGELEEAAGFYRKALAIRKYQLGGNSDTELAATLYNLGGCVCKAGRTEEAEGLFRETLAIQVNTLGGDHLLVARTLHGLGGCARRAGRFREAEALHRRVLEIREAKLGQGSDYVTVGSALHELGVCAFEDGRVEDAEAYLRRALEVMDKAPGDDRRDVAYTLHDLGGCALASGRYAEAQKSFQRALAIREKLGLASSLEVASTLHCLGECARKVEKLEVAQGFFQRALVIRQALLGEDDVYVGYTLFELGSCVREMGKMEEAEAFYRRALAIREDRLGKSHADVVRTLHELAACASGVGRVTDAAKYYTKALKAEEEQLGANHQQVARTLHELAVCVLRAGQVEEGMAFLGRALSIAEDEGGEQQHHLDVALTLHQLGVCAESSGRREEAHALFRGVLFIEESKLGVDHVDLSDVLHNLGECSLASARAVEAAGYFRRALKIEQQSHGPDQPVVAATLHSLGKCAAQHRQYRDAQGLYRQALEIEEEKLGDHTNTADTLFCLGECLEETGDGIEAESAYRRALTIRRGELSETDPELAATTSRLAKVVARNGRLEEAAILYRDALKIEEETLGCDHLDLAKTLQRLAECASGLGQGEEAESFYRRALAVEEKKLGAGHADVATTLHHVAKCAARDRRPDEAAGLYRRALAIEEKKLGEFHISVSGTLLNIGLCALNSGRLDEAEVLYRRALCIEEEHLGADHPDCITTARCLELVASKIAMASVRR